MGCSILLILWHNCLLPLTNAAGNVFSGVCECVCLSCSCSDFRKLWPRNLIFTAQAAVLVQSWEVESHNSVCPSVCPLHACFVTKSKTMHCRYFYTMRKGKHSSYLAPTVVGGRHFSMWNLHSEWPTPFETHRLWQISAYNISNIRDTLKSSVMMNRKLTTGFPTSYRCSMYIAPKSPNGWLKKRFLSSFNRMQL